MKTSALRRHPDFDAPPIAYRLQHGVAHFANNDLIYLSWRVLDLEQVRTDDHLPEYNRSSERLTSRTSTSAPRMVCSNLLASRLLLNATMAEGAFSTSDETIRTPSILLGLAPSGHCLGPSLPTGTSVKTRSPCACQYFRIRPSSYVRLLEVFQLARDMSC
jgi:hypothetical protein